MVKWNFYYHQKSPSSPFGLFSCRKMDFKSLIKETKQQLSPLAISLFNVAATTTSLIDQTKFSPWKKLMVYKTNSVFRCRQFYIQNGWTNCDPSERKRIIGLRFFVSKRASPCDPCYWTEFCFFFHTHDLQKSHSFEASYIHFNECDEFSLTS